MTTATATDEQRAHQEARRDQLAVNLRRFHDALLRTPIAGHYWMWGGLMLGAVREGGLMLHDTEDADFAVRAQDVPLLIASFPALVDAGFAPGLRFPGARGPATEFSFVRDDQKFEFFVIEVEGDRFVWHTYGFRNGTEPVQNVCAMPAQELDEIELVGRTWLKARDADVELTALYDDWRTPAPGHDYLEASTIVARRPWDWTSYTQWPVVYAETGC